MAGFKVLAWTSAICDACAAVRGALSQTWSVHPEHRLREQCCYCGMPTESGRYIRVDPKQVPYPRRYSVEKPLSKEALAWKAKV